jgi:hypothetical protein
MRLALALVLLAGVASGETLPVDGGAVVRADLTQPTDRYDHDVLGDALEWGGLALSVDSCTECAGVQLSVVTITLPPPRVFEDVVARLADLDGDGRAEVIVVETDLSLGASLAVYGPGGKIAATPFIGQPYRWLAPAGIADFDGDGRVEIAYVDRPHLLAELVFVRLAGDRLVETARLPDLTNHRIGDDVISGGLRDCGTGPELILASKDWTRMMRVRRGVVDDLGPMPPGGLVLPPC